MLDLLFVFCILYLYFVFVFVQWSVYSELGKREGRQPSGYPGLILYLYFVFVFCILYFVFVFCICILYFVFWWRQHEMTALTGIISSCSHPAQVIFYPNWISLRDSRWLWGDNHRGNWATCIIYTTFTFNLFRKLWDHNDGENWKILLGRNISLSDAKAKGNEGAVFGIPINQWVSNCYPEKYHLKCLLLSENLQPVHYAAIHWNWGVQNF